MQSTGTLWYNGTMEARQLTDFTCYRVEKHPQLMAAIDRVVELHPDPDLDDAAGHDAYVEMCSWAMTAYYEAGRLDVDDDSEYIGVSLMDMYRLGGSVGNTTPGHTLTGAALKKFLIEAIAEMATSYIQ